MRIDIAVAKGRARALHANLAKRLRAAGHAARFSFHHPAASPPAGLALLMSLEDLVYGPLSADLLAEASLAPDGFDGAPDLVIEFADGAASDGARTLTPWFDGHMGSAAACAALMEGRAPTVTIVERSPEGRLSCRGTGLPALEHPHRFKDSANRVAARVNDLVARAVADIAAGRTAPPMTASAASIHIGAGDALRFAMSALAGRVAARLRKLCEDGESWRVAWRRHGGDSIQRTFAWPSAGLSILPDDGKRYYADPFVMARDGQIHIFVEEFPYATGKGFVSVSTLSANGVPSAPRPVLEAPFHLSWPYVFERGGAVYMMPEARAGNCLRLYRAERFPDVWVEDRVLIDNIAAADPTMLEWGGRLWLFASLAEAGQSDWDTLGLFHAERLDGPWTPHPGNPVMIDATQARAAGHVFQREGRLIRPVQDCARGYGSGLAFCAIDSLDTEAYAQSLAGRLGPPPGSGLNGVHTLNEAAGVEVIDLLGTRQQGPAIPQHR